MKNRNNIKIVVLGILLFHGFTTFAQGADKAAVKITTPLSENLQLLLLTSVVVLVFGAIYALYGTLQAMLEAKRLEVLKAQGIEVAQQEVRPDFFQRIFKKLTNVAPIEKEQDIMLDHNYDGIRELDNSLPPWWLYMFYISIAFTFFYIPYYHWTDGAKSQYDYYEEEMAAGEKIKLAYLRSQADLVNEENAEPLTDEESIAAGENIFHTYCISCHGNAGQGGIGPNLTDKYWLHGGEFKSIFKVIKYGVPEKGMISWSSQLGASDIHKVASFILTLQGTNPPNPKAPQGEPYEK